MPASSERPSSLFAGLLRCAALSDGRGLGKEADRRLRVHRRRILLRWLCLSLEQQEAELVDFLGSQSREERILLLLRLQICSSPSADDVCDRHPR